MRERLSIGLHVKLLIEECRERRHTRGLCEAFEQGYDMQRILTTLKLHSGEDILPKETLIILDEIQECQYALTSLKYFCEDLPEYHVVAAGSLLGLHEHSGTGFPVGKVNIMHLYPMSYTEFMEVCGLELTVELRATCNSEPYYWANINGQTENDFIVQQDVGLVPVEVKAELNLNAKSLKVYCQRFAPAMAIRTSMANYHVQKISLPGNENTYTQLDMPLYAISQLQAKCNSLMQS